MDETIRLSAVVGIFKGKVKAYFSPLVSAFRPILLFRTTVWASMSLINAF
jgi:hypothetical protein